MYKALLFLTALAFAFAFLIPVSAQAVATMDVVNQISQTGFQNYLTSPPGDPMTSITYSLTRSACTGGTVSGSSGSFDAGTQVSVTATPDPGYCFIGWTTDGCGGASYASGGPTYTFAMPANNLALSANFVKAMFADTFETYSMGGTSFDSLDKNDTVGPNQAANGSGNPWWGPLPPNGRISTARSHTGNKSLWGTAGGCKDLYNLQYHLGSGSPFTGGVYLDWWFYDPFGSGGSTTNFCGDYTALSYYTGIPAAADYPTPTPNPMPTPTQQLAVGMSDDLAGGYNPAKYQVRIAGDSGGYHSGWFNTSITRSAGWHHARVIAGPRKSPSSTNDVVFFIDDMSNPVMAPRDSITTVGFNAIEVNTIMPQAGTCTSGTGCVYSSLLHFSNVDDVSFGVAPSAPGSMAATSVGTDSITWHWVDNSSTEDGFQLWDAVAAGSLKGSVGAGIATYPESGLSANTLCSRWVAAYASQFAGSVFSLRAALPATYTLAMPPVYSTSAPNGVRSNNGAGSSSARYAVGTQTTFTAVNGFGTGPTKAGSYLYVWDTSSADPTTWGSASQWTSGTLSQTSGVTASCYMHLRACNGDGAANPTTLTLGPYAYQGTTMVDKISDLWPLSNGLSYALTGKIVSATWSDGFWIEEIDRTAGIRVIWSGIPAVGVGHLVDVAGVLSTGDERILTPPAGGVTDYGAAPNPIGPLGVTEKYIGGAAANYLTPAVWDGLGIYTVGLLVRVAGTAGDAGANFFYLDDGSGLTDGAIKGMKVMCGSLAPKSSGAQLVTGVVGVAGGRPVIYATNITTP